MISMKFMLRTSALKGQFILIFKTSNMLTDFIRDKLITQLKYENGKLFGKFEVSFESVKVDYVIDRCREMDCVHQCQYHFYQLRFMCLCPDPRNAANFVPCQSQAVHRETLENAIKSIEETNNLDQIVIL